MRNSSYFTYAKLNPTENDQHKVDQFCRNTSSFSVYAIDEIRDDLTLMEGCIVFSKKITVFEASNILEGFTVSYTEDFNEKTDEIMRQEVVRMINHHPAVSVKINLTNFFHKEDETAITTVCESEVTDGAW